MKKIIPLIALLLSVLVACKKDLNTANKVLEAPAAVSDSVKILINFLSNSYNVNASDIKYYEKDSVFRLESDMVVYRKDAERNMVPDVEIAKLSSTQDSKLPAKDLPATSQRRNNILVSPARIINVKVRNDCTDPTWRAAASAAIQNFSLPSLTSVSTVRLVEVTSGTVDVVISEVGYADPDNNIAVGRLPFNKTSFPVTNVPGDYVHIFNNHNGLLLAKRILALTHELGHTVGLRHTNTLDGYGVANTPDVDPFSVMNRPTDPTNVITYAFDGFSGYDLIALNALYPRPYIDWQLLPGTATNLAGGDSGFMYAADFSPLPSGDFNFKRWNIVTGSWGSTIAGLSGIKMTVGPGGLIYFITKAKKIYMDAFPAPIQLPGEAIDIAANSSGELFIVSNTPLNADGNMIKKWNGSSWDQYTDQGAKKIAIGPGPGAELVIIANSGLVMYNKGYGWGSYGLTANEIAVCNSKLDVTGNIILFVLRNVVVNSAGDYLIQRYTGVDWYSLLGGAVSITIDGDGHPWLTNKGGLIYRNLQF